MHQVCIKKFVKTHYKSIVLALTMLFMFFICIFEVSASTLKSAIIIDNNIHSINLSVECEQYATASIYIITYKGSYPENDNIVGTSSFGCPSIFPTYIHNQPLEVFVLYPNQNNPIDNVDYWRHLYFPDFLEIDYIYLLYRYSLNNWTGLGYFICGGENYLQFCQTQAECESYGGYWSNDFCYEEQIDIIDFDAYYQEHSDFDTPTFFISSLTGFISPFLQSAGNLLKTFKGNFDITQAVEKGYLLGNSISQARGYLDIVNDFFGGLPISEMLLLFIITTILIVIVRLVIKIIHIVKP